MPSPEGREPRVLDPDVHPWERQPGETHTAYESFRKWLESEKRIIGEYGGKSAYDLAAVWSWQHRALQWDRYIARVDLEEMIRYRRAMNNRHRTASRALQGAVIKWLDGFDPKTLKPSEAIKFWEVAVRVEREAAGLSADDVDEAVAAFNAARAALNPTADDALDGIENAPRENAPTVAELLAQSPRAAQMLEAALRGIEDDE